MSAFRLSQLATITGAVVADYAVKRFVENNFALHQVVDVLPFLAVFRTNNTGIAFSMFDWVDERWLIALPIAIVLLVAYLAFRTTPAQWVARLGFSLIIGGAIGNLIDRATLGYVVDYVLFHVGNWSFAIFNLADAFISVGAALVLLQEFIDWRRRSESRT